MSKNEQKLIVRPINAGDLQCVRDILSQRWGGTKSVSRGRILEADKLDGFMATIAGKIEGLITLKIDDDRCEIATLDAMTKNNGIGTRLLEEAEKYARRNRCRFLWLITTNDNVDAMRFYQLRDFDLKCLHYNAMEISRQLKPSIPKTGNYGISIKHEIEFEKILE